MWNGNRRRNMIMVMAEFPRQLHVVQLVGLLPSSPPPTSRWQLMIIIVRIRFWVFRVGWRCNAQSWEIRKYAVKPIRYSFQVFPFRINRHSWEVLSSAGIQLPLCDEELGWFGYGFDTLEERNLPRSHWWIYHQEMRTIREGREEKLRRILLIHNF